jgi:hypothetical protein
MRSNYTSLFQNFPSIRSIFGHGILDLSESLDEDEQKQRMSKTQRMNKTQRMSKTQVMALLSRASVHHLPILNSRPA